MPLIPYRHRETGELLLLGDGWLDAFPDDPIVAISREDYEQEIAARQAEADRLAEQQAPATPPATEQAPPAAPPAAAEQPAPRGRF